MSRHLDRRYPLILEDGHIIEGNISRSRAPKLSSHSYREAVGGMLISKYRKKLVTMSEEKKSKPVSIFKLFRYASCLDWLLVFVGTINAILLGAAFPIAMNVFGDITNAFVQYDASRMIATTSQPILCPTSEEAVFITNFTSLVGGDDFTCGTTFTFTDPISSTMCNFTLDTVQASLFGSSSACLDDRSFIDEINFQVYIFIGIALAAWLVGSFQGWFYQSAAEHQLHKIRLRLYGSILRQDIAWFDANPTGELSYRMSGDIDKIYDGIGDNIGKLIKSVSTFLAAIVVGFVREWRLALLLLAVVPFMAIAGAIFTRLGSIFSSREQKEYASAGAVAEEVLSEVKTVFAFGGEAKETERYNSYLANANKSGFIKGAAVGSNIGSIYFLIFLVYSISFWFGAFLVSEELAQPGDVITVFFAILVGAFEFGQVGPFIQNLVEAMGAAGGVYEIIDRKPVIDALSEEGIVPDADKFKCDVEFKDVKFNYPTRPDTEVLKGLSLKVQNGETLAIVGGSGSGKTTVIELVQRFYDTIEGEVLIGGHNIKDLNLQWLRSKIGVVSQEPILFNSTIAENIRYGKMEATMYDIEEAAKLANAHDFISSLPEGYDTVVGEDGDLLSGGQKQRVAIARALVRNPVILLLDEATSALDAQSERIVQNALDAACIGRTTFIIAHRLSTIRNATKIASIKDGVVSEIGTHEELMQKEGVYHELVTDQTYSDQLPRPESSRFKKSFCSISTVRRKSRKASVSFAEGMVRSAARTVRVTRKRKSSGANLSVYRKTQSSPKQYNRTQSSPGPEGTQSSPRKLKRTQSSPPPEGGLSSTQEECSRVGDRKKEVSIELDVIDGDEQTTAVESIPSDVKSFEEPAPRFVDNLDDEDEDAYLPDVSFFQLLRLSNRTMLCAIVLGTLAAFVGGLITPAFSLVFGEVVEVFGRRPSEVLSGTHVWGAVFLGLGMLIALMSFLKHLCFSVSGATLSGKVRSLLFKSILHQDISWFDEERNSTIALTQKLSYDAGLIQGAVGIRVGTLVEALTTLVAALVVAFAYSWVLAFVVVGFMPLIALSSVLNFSLTAGTTKLKTQTLRDTTEVALEGIRHIHTVAALGLEKTYYENFANGLQRPYLLTLCLSPLFGITYGMTQSIVLFGYIIAFRFGAYQVTLPTDHIAYTEFENVFRVFAAIIFGAIGIGAATSFTPDYKQVKLAARRVFAIINREPIIDNYSEEGHKPESTTGNIQMNSVFFSYPERADISVLKELNLSVQPGKMLALVGASGSGKSTIMSLIERFYDPSAGNVTLDSIDFLDLNLRWLRSQIGIVSQEPVLFDCSIAENIRYGALFREVSDEEVIEAAKSANIHSFIESLPEGYNTKVGSKGTQLSGGQKQRVAIARALVRDPKVLLLDEATSALDTESEKIVQEALDKAREGRTSIVIAHRLSTIRNADSIAVMRGGKVTELGTHSELLAKKGLYYKLNRYQFGREGTQPTAVSGAPLAVTKDAGNGITDQ